MRTTLLHALKRIAKVVLTALCISLIFFILFVNHKLYQPPTLAILDSHPVNASVLHQLKYLEKSILKGAANDMQQLYPEGYVFINALYGLAWSDIAGTITSSKLRDKAIQQLTASWEAIDGPVGRIPFEESLSIPMGAFYSGWNNYLLGKLLALQPPTQRDSVMVEKFKTTCDAISQAIKKEIFPASYSGMHWPADGVIGVASLRLHDQVFTQRYQSDISSWILRAKSKVDSRGLIPHRTDEQGNTIVLREEARKVLC